ncbi:unnamed protein product, partial [Mesorhabditis belari]|uniref:Uncharacterized protein n=1 Tax=Mesorhabditis belari TaxID=2138241 RepID=A0AAF3EU92_9BILA
MNYEMLKVAIFLLSISLLFERSFGAPQSGTCTKDDECPYGSDCVIDSEKCPNVGEGCRGICRSKNCVSADDCPSGERCVIEKCGWSGFCAYHCEPFQLKKTQ